MSPDAVRYGAYDLHGESDYQKERRPVMTCLAPLETPPWKLGRRSQAFDGGHSMLSHALRRNSTGQEGQQG